MANGQKLDRDVFVLLTMAFGYGALFSWALFYRADSIPPLKEVDPAAWIQAIGALLGILVAIAIPTAIHFSEGRRQRAKEKNKAKSVFAFAQKDLQQVVAMLGVTKWLVSSRAIKTPEEELAEWEERSRVPQAVIEAMKEAHEFPALLDDLYAFYFQMNQLNETVRHHLTMLPQDAKRPAVMGVREQIDPTIEIGNRLLAKVNELFDR
ncbi:MAG: hypothetical protein BSK19_07610 [Stenotrophomonas maltophilia]|nr:MAG: hypothetical protein BSK19_07610 [Stenotrophomonas maltophilia]